MVADHLSRHPPTVASLAVFEVSNRNFEDLVLETSRGAEVKKLVGKGTGEMKNGLLYYDQKAYTPIIMRDRVIDAHHDEKHAGHKGVQAIIEKVRRAF